MTQDVYDTVQTDDLTANRLLAGLPENELAALRPHATLVSLERRALLYRSEQPIEHVYFLIDGIASLLSVMTDGTGVETATIGREGMVGMPVFHGVNMTAEQALMQVPGRGYRFDAGTFAGLLDDTPTLRTLLHRFSVVMFTLAAQNSGCNRKHSIEERCCRWLLMVADRLDRATFDLTHDFVAQMLGVRRASVTEALGSLEKRGLIGMSRGRITILDRQGLERCTCECYAVIRSAMERVLEGKVVTSPLAAVHESDDGKSAIGVPQG